MVCPDDRSMCIAIRTGLDYIAERAFGASVLLKMDFANIVHQFIIEYKTMIGIKINGSFQQFSNDH